MECQNHIWLVYLNTENVLFELPKPGAQKPMLYVMHSTMGSPLGSVCALKGLQQSWLNASLATLPLTQDHAHITKVLCPSELMLPEKYPSCTAGIKTCEDSREGRM